MLVNCKNCGSHIATNAKVCEYCDTSVATAGLIAGRQTAPMSAERVGYSPVVDTPEFQRLARKKNRGFGVHIAIVAVVCLIIGGVVGESIFEGMVGTVTGFVLGIVFAIVTCFCMTSPRKQPVVIDSVVTRKETLTTTKLHFGSFYRIYFIEPDGQEVYFPTTTFKALEYYQLGDKVRYYKQFRFLEKYDKSRDTINLCAMCHAVADIRADRCPKCGAPLLK